MSATPEWMKDFNEQADDADQPQDALEGEYEEPQEPQEGEEAQEHEHQEPQTVPLATMIEERKKLQAQLEEERARAARFERLEDEIRRIRAERQQNVSREAPQAPPKREVPDYLEDPRGYVDATKEELVERLQKLEGQTNQASQAAQAMAFERQVRTALAAAEQSYSQQTPDYYDALQHLRQVKAQELALMYPQAKPEQITTMLNQQEIAWGAQQLQQNQNPSEQAYKWAQALGYQPKSGQNQGQEGDTSPQGKSGSGVDRRRLQGMGGAQAGRAQSDSELERLMDGSPDEFDQAMSELFGKRGR
jgi:hypothetical protein